MALSTLVAQEKPAESTLATTSQSPLLEDVQYYQIRTECLPPPV